MRRGFTACRQPMEIPMLTLCGFHGSNYYSKVKLALIEKNLEFTEKLADPRKVDISGASPMAKVPYLETEHGPISESQVIMEYLEERFPTPALMPADSFARAKVRELCTYLDMHIELSVRKLYGQAFFGGTVSDKAKEAVHAELSKAIKATLKLSAFENFAYGDAFTTADCCALTNLPIVSMATKAVYGEDLLAGTPIPAYLARHRERPSLRRVAAERKAAAQPAKA
jgi:glutathione S-transferase